MVRAALGGASATRQPLPARVALLLPAASVIAGSAVVLLPIVTQTGWVPEFGLLMLLAWRLLRSDPWPLWGAVPLGLANDLLSGGPLGLSIVTWTAAMLALDLAERRTMWRDYWIEWLLGALLILWSESARWWAAGLAGADLPYATIWPRVAISALLFPLAARLAVLLDQRRLGTAPAAR